VGMERASGERGNSPFGGRLLGLIVTQRPVRGFVKILSVRAAIYQKNACRFVVMLWIANSMIARRPL
jgi:hypothetical protein